MQATLKRLHSPDVRDLQKYLPEPRNDFGFLLQAMIGPIDREGEEAFDLIVCTPEWIKREYEGRILLGQHHLIISEYDYSAIHKFIETFARRCIGQNWRDVAERLNRLGRWEFEDYREC